MPAYQLYREGIADKDYEVAEIVAHLPAALQLFHTGSLAITPSQQPKIHALLAYLRERGVGISVDLNIRAGASADPEAYLQGVRSLLPLCDFVKASDDDLAALCLHADPRRAAELAFEQMSGGVLVMTCGSNGSVTLGAFEPIELPAFPVSRPVDTVGAGDTFHAAFLACLARREALASPATSLTRELLTDAVTFASAAAAINVARAGCQPPDQAETDAALEGSTRL